MHTPSLHAPESALGQKRRRPTWAYEATFHVEGLSCRSCARHAEDALRALPGVQAASVGFFGEIAQVLYDVRRTSEREIASAMATRGFRLSAASGAPPSERGELDAGRLGLVIALSANLVALASWKGARERASELAWIELGFVILLFVVAGPPLLVRAASLLRRRALGAEVVALVCASFATLVGVAAMVFSGTPGHEAPALLARLGFQAESAALTAFEAAGAILGFTLVGSYLHAALLARAFAPMHAAASLKHVRIRRIGPAGEDDAVPFALLDAGDRVRLTEGEIAPITLVLETTARVLLPSGVAEDRFPGQTLAVGTRLLSAEMIGRVVEAPGAELEAAADAEVQRVALRIEREARLGRGPGFTPVASLALSVSALSFAGFALVVHAVFGGGPLHPTAMLTALAVLIGASPAAMLMGVPAARTIAVIRARAAGVVVRDPAALEALGSVKIACFDKTGTVTMGAPRVTRLVWLSPEEVSILEDVVALESASTHPAGRAIRSYLAAAGIQPGTLDEKADVRGDGVVGRARGALVEISAARRGDPVSSAARFGASIVCFRRNGVALGFFELWDAPREGAERAMRALWQRGIGCRLLSGDGHDAALAVAHKLGVPALGGLGPVEKALLVRDLQHDGQRVLHIRDGRTDMTPIPSADVSIAIAPGTLPTSVVAPIVLTTDRLDTLAWLLDLGRALRQHLRVSLGFGIVYNALVIPLAAMGLLGPLGAAALALGATAVACGIAARMLDTPLSPRTPKPVMDRPTPSAVSGTSTHHEPLLP